MRTNIEIDDELLAEAQAVTGASTKKEAVRLGLETLVRLGRQAQLRRLRGQLYWEGDLDAMRRDDA
jgi:Arc/MetJ family transcription regulator